MSTFKVGGTAPGAKKKLVIKPFKSQPQVPQDFEEQTWNKLQLALDAINRKTAVETSKEELCQAVEDACRHRLAVSLYAKLSEHCRRHINSKVDTLTKQTLDEAAFLQLVVSLWRDHCDHMSTIRNIFIHLDRTYALEAAGVRPVLEMGTHFFRLRVEQNKELEKKIVVSAIAVIEAERQGFSADRDALRQVLRMFTALGTYSDIFEIPFIMQSRAFFLSDVQTKLPQGGGNAAALSDFLSHVELRLVQAAEMCTAYLDPSTKPPLTAVIEDVMLRPHISMLLQMGAHALFDQSIERVDDLRRLYALCERVQATEQVKQSWAAYIKLFGQHALAPSAAAFTGSASERTAQEVSVVESLINFHDRMQELLKSAFHNIEAFKLAMKGSFATFFNEQETSKRSRPAELLCKFIDKKLCGGEKKAGLSESEMEALLDRVLSLFRFLQGQDVFEAFYKKALARRLLLETTTNIDLETQMIRKLKAECGGNFTAKLEGMLTDMTMSRDVIEHYALHCEDHPVTAVEGSKPVEAKIQVLTVGYWPTYPATGFSLPPPLQASQDHFSSFYMEKYQGRRMSWVHFLSRCVLGASYRKGRKEFDVPLSQAVVMLLFNDAEGGLISFSQLLSLSKLDESLLKVCLHTLSCGPPVFRLLEKTPAGKEINSTDSFSLVTDYSNKLFRIRYKHQEVKDANKEEEQTQEEVVRERHHCIDAAIVRIMKSRKRLSHQGLLSEAMAQLRFPCAGSDIKRRIETLIEREYLERDRHDNSVYNYLA